MIRRPPRSTLFPTRRSSDLCDGHPYRTHPGRSRPRGRRVWHRRSTDSRLRHHPGSVEDRKSTRLNSSHLGISYAVFCLKKKNKNKKKTQTTPTKLYYNTVT